MGYYYTSDSGLTNGARVGIALASIVVFITAVIFGIWRRRARAERMAQMIAKEVVEEQRRAGENQGMAGREREVEEGRAVAEKRELK